MDLPPERNCKLWGKTKLPGLPATEAGHGTGGGTDARSGKGRIEVCGYSHFYIEITLIGHYGQDQITLSL
jgi:hypothetical protein